MKQCGSSGFAPLIVELRIVQQTALLPLIIIRSPMSKEGNIDYIYTVIPLQKCWAVNPVTIGLSDYKHTRLSIISDTGANIYKTLWRGKSTQS